MSFAQTTYILKASQVARQSILMVNIEESDSPATEAHISYQSMRHLEKD